MKKYYPRYIDFSGRRCHSRVAARLLQKYQIPWDTQKDKPMVKTFFGTNISLSHLPFQCIKGGYCPKSIKSVFSKVKRRKKSVKFY